MKLEAGRFLGKTSSSYSANGVRVSVQSYSANANLPDHAHELPHFCMVLAGSYNERIGSRSFERKPTALVYYPPEVSHAEEHFRHGRHFLVEIDPAGLDSVRSRGSGLDRPILVDSGSSFEIAMRMYCEFRTRDELSGLALESLSTELLISASRQQAFGNGRTPPRWLERAKEYLNECYSDPPALAELAAAVEVHPTHLARVFRKFEHCTAGDYVRRVRIEKARTMMIETDLPLVEIALETGFSDQSHFTRSFTKEMGITPTEFRRTFDPR